MKNSGKTVSKRCAALSVAEITTLRGPARRSRNGNAADAVLTTMRRAGSPLNRARPLRRLEIRTNQIELGVGTVERAVTNQDDQEQIVRRHARPERARWRGARSPQSHWWPPSRLFEHHNVARHELHTLAQHARELIGPSRVLFEVRRTAARAGHDQRVALTGRRGNARHEHEMDATSAGADTSSSKSPPAPQQPLRRQQRDDRQEGP